MIRFPLLLFIALICISCSSQIDTNPDTVLAESKKSIPEKTINCSAPAQVHDRSKIEAILEKKGTITSEMNSDERRKIVSEYIKRKTKPKKDCIK